MTLMNLDPSFAWRLLNKVLSLAHRTEAHFQSQVDKIHMKLRPYLTVDQLTLTQDGNTLYPHYFGPSGEIYYGQWKLGYYHGKGIGVWAGGEVY